MSKFKKKGIDIISNSSWIMNIYLRKKTNKYLNQNGDI